MRKFFTLVAMAFVAVCANAQSVVAEIDWTQQAAYYEDVWHSDGCTVNVTSEGLVIESTPADGANYWEPQIPMIAHIESITEGGQYQVQFTLNAPAAGEIRLDFCSWDGTGATSAYVINVEAGEKDYVVDFPDYPTECTNAMIFFQCGHMPGTHVIKNVKVLDLEGEEAAGGIVADIDWTTQSAYYDDVWHSDACTVTVTEGEGLIIESTPADGANYWEPQIPMIAHIPAVTEGGQYQVKFTVNAPADGEIRLDFCSWDGTGATSAYVINVTAGEAEYVVDFPDYPTECTNAMIFYQCGHMPGTHIIKNVTVIDLEANGDDPGDDPGVGDHVYSVIGTIVGNWDNDADMVLGGGGLYVYHFENVAAGSYEFKIRQDHDWAVNWGSDFKQDGPNCKVDVATDGSTIIVTFNDQTGEIAWEVVAPDEPGEPTSAIVAEIDWTAMSAYYDDVWHSDACTVTVTEGQGLVIESTPADGANYWEPQIPMIAHIPAVTEGGQYQVKFTVNAPADGEIRLDFCSWDGTGATSAYVINVTAGEAEYVVDFPDYPTECTNAMIFYQCGHMPGTHVIKNVQVIDLEADAIQAVKTVKADGAIYNLAGQKVNASYKGVVIMNGKKFLQK